MTSLLFLAAAAVLLCLACVAYGYWATQRMCRELEPRPAVGRKVLRGGAESLLRFPGLPVIEGPPHKNEDERAHA